VDLWRVSDHAALDGAGGTYTDGRWHRRGHPIVYCALNPSTALLETLVHIELDAEDRPRRFQLLKIEVPDAVSRQTVEDLPPAWANDVEQTRSLGDRWLFWKRSLLLEVPSALVPETWNVLINPVHAQANSLKIAAIYDHALDARLFE
jgi:RES domain-containing protein